ncbi:uncharacterized protein isoform X2 [Choristoneura fumiferana]|uniref:uncharacterized protein isoform X2 n=1 Tax=Choristoneura fumiferana TaxID=7141 RepID=UPI003D158F0D
MILRSLFLCLVISSATASLRLLFPYEDHEYTYDISANVSGGSLTPQDSSYWTMDGQLVVTAYDNFTRVRYRLDYVKGAQFSKNTGYYVEAIAKDIYAVMSQHWEADYTEHGLINSVYIKSDEPLWSQNMKRALSLNFQLNNHTYKEPCLYATCVAVCFNQGRTIRKYTNSQLLPASAERSWSSVNVFGNAQYDDLVGVPDVIATAERVYEFDDKIGLKSLDMKGTSLYKVQDRILSVNSILSLNYKSERRRDQIDKLNVTQMSVQYVSQGYTDPTDGINSNTQGDLKNTAYALLLRISRKGIDADNIVRNASMIHSLDFIDLLNTMTQLNYVSLSKLFEDMVLSTSYDLETSRNIFLEVLPHVRTHACALFVKYLVMEQKDKIEDTTILSLIRKLPFNVANYSQSLLEDLEVFTKLGLDYPRDIRHAAILSFATLVHRTMEARMVKLDFFDNIVVKYFRMYSDCPQYNDRMVWLQGLCNMGYSADAYTRTVYVEKGRDRHERLWAALADVSRVNGYTILQTSLPVLMDDSEHIQLRIAALHALLSADIRASDFIYIHNYITRSNNNQLKRFWYTTVKSLEKCKLYSEYKAASYYVPFVASQVSNPDSTYWATNNYVFSTEENEVAAAIQFMSVGESVNALPAFAAVKLSTGGRRPHHIAAYIVAEGVTTNMFKKIHTMNEKEIKIQELVRMLRSFKLDAVKAEKVHIDVVVKIHDKAVFATHINQSRFDSWNGEDLTRSIEDFLRFGSHINQQMVYYPFQMDVSIPTELGTPIRLQSTVVSFASLRGNLTAPNSQHLTWRNDLHIRYQATAVSAMRTDGPLLQTKHEAILQRSLVAHLPIKSDVTISPKDKSFQLKWPNPGAQNGGVAMHSRLQIIMTSFWKRDSYTVTTGDSKYKVDDTGVFFDCERPMTGAEVMEKLFATKTPSYDYLSTLQPSLILLNGFLLLTAPSTSCGVILPPRRLMAPGQNTLDLKLQIAELTMDYDDRLKIKLLHSLAFREDKSNGEVFLNISGYTKLESAGGNLTVQMMVSGQQPRALDPTRRQWKICLQERDTSHPSSDQDVTSHPASYEGQLHLTYNTGDSSLTCPANSGSRLQIHYRGYPNIKQWNTRHFEVNMTGSKLPKLGGFAEASFGSHTPIGQLLTSFDQQPLNVTAVVKETDGLTFVRVNNGAGMEFRSENFAWLLDSWTNMQIMKKFGIYRECRVEEYTVKSLFGKTEQPSVHNCYEFVALADCTSAPRFAVFRRLEHLSETYTIYSGGNYVTVTSPGKGQTVTVTINGVTECQGDCRYPSQEPFYDFKVTRLADFVKVHSRLSGVQLHYRHHDSVLLAPTLALSTSCGVCAGHPHSKQC